MKKISILLALICTLVFAAAGCSDPEEGFDKERDITVISREEGSGTRGAFIELFGIEEKNSDGEKIDRTTEEAVIKNDTAAMMTTVAGNPYAIGYISMGSLNDTVKAVKIDGVEATVANIKADTYQIARPFNIATKETVSEAAQDFIDFILSSEGQKVVEDFGCIAAVDSAAPYSGSKPAGKIAIAGSSSVTPVMERLKEAYQRINPNADIAIQQSDSSAGMTSAIEGLCDIGMASREIKDSELEKGLKGTVIAIDGIAVIVNHDSPIDNLTSTQVKEIFTGASTVWSDVIR